MKQNEMFGSAKWISAGEENAKESFIIRKTFEANGTENAKIKLIGLGTFVLYVNGKRVEEDLFLPLASEYEYTNCPPGEELSYRIYCTEYDISSYLRKGKNVLAVHLGFGWYTGIVLWKKFQKSHGEKKLIYSLSLSDSSGERVICSDGSEKWNYSFVKDGNIHNGEIHDYREWNEECLGADFDDDGWASVRFSKPVESDYLYTDCPADIVSDLLSPTVIKRGEGYVVYDAGRNISGYPILVSHKGVPSEIKVTFSEILGDDGELSPTHMHDQAMSYITGEKSEELYPAFTWFGFRYFRVDGAAEVKHVAVAHSNVKVGSHFESDNETLNWLYQTFIYTQLNNMHRGIPSDCPHIERLGYTGDGELVCRSALHALDAKAFYRKWIGDIFDCQDRKTGHIQYTAPYIRAGGGPGGWGCAIVTVPYEYWKFYGETDLLEKLFPNMLKYLDFLEEHSEYGLVMSDIKGNWTLGDWCTPPDNSNLPAPFVNTYFYVLSMNKVKEIAAVIGKEKEVSYLDERIEKCIDSILKFYYGSMSTDETFVGNTLGASAFGIALGLGTEKTKNKLASHYERIGCYDTGIFGTELVTRALFEMGRADIAFKLLTAEEPIGFGRWCKEGETALPEYWENARSHDHPMFGAVIASVFEYIVGIQQAKDSVGYDKVVISPVNIDGLNSVSGGITTPHGKIFVSYTKKDLKTEYVIDIPSGVSAILNVSGAENLELSSGLNTVTV